MGRLRVQEEKEAWIEGGEERGEGEKGGECKRPEGAAALHNQIPRWCSRMRSTLSAVRRKSRGGGWGIPRAREHSEKCTPSFPSLRFARSQGHPSPKSFNRTPRGIPGINRKHLLVSSTGGPREISTEGRFKGGGDDRRGENRLGEIFHSKGPRNFRRVWGFYFLVGEEGCYVEGNEEWCLV